MTEAKKRRRFCWIAGGFLIGLAAALLCAAFFLRRAPRLILPRVRPIPMRLAPNVVAPESVALEVVVPEQEPDAELIMPEIAPEIEPETSPAEQAAPEPLPPEPTPEPETTPESEPQPKLSPTPTEDQAIALDLAEYDALCLNAEAADAFLRRFIRRWPGTDYAVDFAGVLAAEELRGRVETWNSFVERLGGALARFALSPEESFGVVDFYAQNAETLDFLPDWPTLQKRMPELAVSARGVPVQEKATALFHALGTPYFVYQTPDDRRYYLMAEPVAGENRYRADLFGGEKTVRIPAKELDRTAPDRQGRFFSELADAARGIPDELRVSDPARWYAAWSALAEKLRTAKELDPLAQFFALGDLVRILSSADYYFDRQFSPWKKMLDDSRIPAGLDYFSAEDTRLPEARTAARERLVFLPSDLLTIGKSSAELDRSVPNLGFFYRIVGWLDQDTAGVWRLRPAKSAPGQRHDTEQRGAELRSDEQRGVKSNGDGPLYVFRLNSRSEPETLEVGAVTGGAAQVTMIGTGLLRGLPVYARIEYENTKIETAENTVSLF